MFTGLARRLPPDMRLCPVDEVGRQDAAGPPPSDMARLRVALCGEPMTAYRLDVIRPGTAFVVPIRLGWHVLSARVWLRSLELRDQINALPGTDPRMVLVEPVPRSR